MNFFFFGGPVEVLCAFAGGLCNNIFVNATKDKATLLS